MADRGNEMAFVMKFVIC